MLPWRQTRDPFAILVSELMLQQTQAATVIPYFHRFLARFPTAESLAAAPIDDVLKLWEGLGYYRRARLLHAAARQIVQEHGGTFPQRFDEIAALPGVGRYTAGAVASFAFGQPRPIVEANTQRLHARLLKLQNPLSSTASQKQLWGFAEAILSRRHAAEINHAVMDLGAMVCKPRSPTCLICPVRELCPTQRENLQDRIPLPARRPAVVERYESVVAAIDRSGNLWLWRRPEGGWWAGMWDLPRLTADPQDDAADERVTVWVSRSVASRLELREVGPVFRYGVTHHKIAARLLICDSRPAVGVVAENFPKIFPNAPNLENCFSSAQLGGERMDDIERLLPGEWQLTDTAARRGLALTRSARAICEYLASIGAVR